MKDDYVHSDLQTSRIAALCAAVPELTVHSVEAQPDGSVLVRYAYPQAVETLIRHLYAVCEAELALQPDDAAGTGTSR